MYLIRQKEEEKDARIQAEERDMDQFMKRGRGLSDHVPGVKPLSGNTFMQTTPEEAGNWYLYVRDRCEDAAVCTREVAIVT
jgi:hypothetical protein